MAELKIDLGSVQTDCCKPACHRLWVHRHHGGNELLVIKLLQRYKPEWRVQIERLEERYKQFHKDDVCRVCEEHHAEGHELLDAVVRWYFREHGRPACWKKLSTFMGLQKECRRQTELWLKRKTPGLKNGFKSLNAIKRQRKLRLRRPR